MLTPDNPFTKMQKSQYEREASLMNQENHKGHNDNPDYWGILVIDTQTPAPTLVGLDFGCGCGRNILNLRERMYRMDGCDISQGNLDFTRKNIEKVRIADSRYIETSKLYCVDGVGLGCIPSNEYDFVMSTIVLQHIPVYDVRFAILKDIYRVLKPGGLLSFQMGFGKVSLHNAQGIAQYHENALHAQATNSAFDVQVTNTEDIKKDLVAIGFKPDSITFQIRPPWTDRHQNWVYVKARK